MSPRVVNPHVGFVGYSTLGGGARYDLTDKLTRVSVERSLSRDSPAAAWGVALVSSPGAVHRTWAYRADPQDYVEVILGHGGPAQTVVRGFMDNTRESMGSGDDGAPAWQVMLNGRDFGKLFLVFQIYYVPIYAPAEALDFMPGIGAALHDYGIEPGEPITPADFVAKVMAGPIGKNLAALRGMNPAIPDIGINVTVPDIFTINTISVQSFTGAVWNLLGFFADQPWIEMFVEEEAGGPVFNMRFAPLKDRQGHIASPYAADPGDVVVSVEDVVMHSLGKSDNEALTYFYTWGRYMAQMEQESRFLYAKFGNPHFDQERFKRFGFRPLDIGTYLIPTVTGQSQVIREQVIPSTWAMAIELNQWLVSVFSFNEELFSGTITLYGNPEIRLGKYLYVEETGWEYYIEGYTHEWAVGGACTTTVQVTRGRKRPIPWQEPIQNELSPRDEEPGLPPPGGGRRPPVPYE